MAFNVKKRGKLTYYSTGDRPVLSALVTEGKVASCFALFAESDGDFRTARLVSSWGRPA
jgi:hypothetical protein